MKRILIVDDDPVCRELIRETLQSESLQILEASTGQDALEMIERGTPDLILLDIQMPHSTGYQVLKAIRRNPKTDGLRVAALTAYAMREDREKGLAAGFDDYITKPVEVAALRTAVGRLLGK